MAKKVIFNFLLFSITILYCCKNDIKTKEKGFFFKKTLQIDSLNCVSTNKWLSGFIAKTEQYSMDDVYKFIFKDSNVICDSLRVFLRDCKTLYENKIIFGARVEYVSNLEFHIDNFNFKLKQINIYLTDKMTWVIYYCDEYKEINFISSENEVNFIILFFNKNENLTYKKVVCNLVSDTGYVLNKIAHPSIIKKMKFIPPELPPD